MDKGANLMTNYPNPESLPAETRQRIITAAMRLFGRQGYSQTTTRAIAAEAGVNEVTLFRHFGSKKGLLAACIEAYNAAGFAATFEAGLSGDYPQDILHMARLQVEGTAASLAILSLLACDARNVPELRQAMLAGSRGNLQRLSAYFQRQIDLGVVRPGLGAEALASAFDSLFSSNMIFEYMFQGSLSSNLSSEAVIQPLVELFVGGSWAQSERIS
jgi:AcrR family transcriptional regulator